MLISRMVQSVFGSVAQGVFREKMVLGVGMA